MPKPKIHIAGNQNYACLQCGRCCRRFHVLLREEELERFQAIDWNDEIELPEGGYFTRIGGMPYFARTASGACVFLEEEKGTCLMHRRLGYKNKALTCRGYPLNIASTFWGEVSVTARMDCPAVQQNHGPPITGKRGEIAKLVAELGTSGGFTREQMEGLNRETIDTIIRGLRRVLTENDALGPGSRAWAFLLAGERLQALGKNFLNDTPTLEEILPALLERAGKDAQQRPGKRIGAFSRALFREWLAAYCRRDEELLRPSVGTRLRRTLELGKLFFGAGNLRRLGWEHPDLPLRAARIFPGRDRPAPPSKPEVWECFLRLLLSRLETYQLFGVSYYDKPFFTGLRALALAYPLTLAAARVHAAAADREELLVPDIEYAVGAVDHCLGRSPLLQFRLWRSIEKHFSGARFPALLEALGWE